nr:hypothetical protein [Mycobacterium uberis]
MTAAGNHQNGQQLSDGHGQYGPLPLANLNGPVRPADVWGFTGNHLACGVKLRWRTLGCGGRRWVTLGTCRSLQERLLDASILWDSAYVAVSEPIIHIDEINRRNVFPVVDSDTGR